MDGNSKGINSYIDIQSSVEDVIPMNLYLVEPRTETNSGNNDDDDDEPSLITWTKSPDDEADYSDWKIDVIIPSLTTEVENEKENGSTIETKTTNRSSTNIVATYSVHRFPLGERSKYFKGLFNNNFSESHARRSTIELPTPATTLRHFELVLDHLYHKTLNFENDDSVAMIYFGDYFGIKALKESAQHNIRCVCKISSIPIDIEVATRVSKVFALYYRAAKQLGMKDLQDALMFVVACQYKLMSKDTELFKMIDIQFWSGVLLWTRTMRDVAADDEHENNIRNWSINVAYFIEQNLDEIIVPEIFRVFTNIDALPYISPEVAISMMQQEQYCYGSGRKEQEHDILTCLQKRCIDALYNKETGEWQVEIKQELKQGRLRKISPIVLETLLLQMVEYTDIKQHHHPESIAFYGAGSSSSSSSSGLS